MHFMKKSILLFLVMAFAFSGCALFGSKAERSAQELASDGMEAYNAGKYGKSRETFEQLKDWYPFSKYAILAELKIADCHYRLQEYPEAILAYEEFEKLHPRNEAVPYVIFQTGLCWFEQVDTIDRDQETARHALETFRRLQKQYPHSPYSGKAEGYATRCLKSLAGHEFYVGKYYYRTKHYKAAMSRFRSVLCNYPDVGVHQETLKYIGLCQASLLEQEAAEKKAEEDKTPAKEAYSEDEAKPDTPEE